VFERRFEGGGRKFQVIGSAAIGRFDENANDFRQIAESFKLAKE
jgi:hypothetical protein